MSEYTATVVKRWAKAYQNAKTLQYVETLTFLPPDKKGKPTQVTLRFWGKQPNLTRVEVSIEGANEDAVMISDGTTIWEYYRPRNAYMKTPMPDVGLMVQGELGSLVYVTGPSLMFLPDPYPALVRGAVSLKAQKSSKEIAVTRVQEDKMVLTWLDAKDYLPRRFKVYQVQTEGLTEVMSGTRTRVVVDETLPKSVFTFVRPARAKQVVPENPAKALLKAGTLLPNMTAYNEEGQEVRLSALRGKPTFYVFWAHWLPLSMEFLSQLTQLKAELAEEGQEIEIVGIDVWDDPDALAQFRRTHPNSSAILLRDKNMERVHAMTTAYKRFGVRGLPTVYLVDSGGKIKKGWVGADRGNLIDMRKRIVSLSAE
jgi:outer membrane lipoprotein-sorting protein/peroxiredoxin